MTGDKQKNKWVIATFILGVVTLLWLVFRNSPAGAPLRYIEQGGWMPDLSGLAIPGLGITPPEITIEGSKLPDFGDATRNLTQLNFGNRYTIGNQTTPKQEACCSFCEDKSDGILSFKTDILGAAVLSGPPVAHNFYLGY